jgi:hypothetical protein
MLPRKLGALPALAYRQGKPLRSEIEAAGFPRLVTVGSILSIDKILA